MKKILITLITLSILGIIIYSWIEHFNMDTTYYIKYRSASELPEYWDEINLDLKRGHSRLSNFQKYSTIIDTILLVLTTSDIILILTTKFESNSNNKKVSHATSISSTNYKKTNTKNKQQNIESDLNTTSTETISCKICGKKIPYNKYQTCSECNKKIENKMENML